MARTQQLGIAAVIVAIVALGGYFLLTRGGGNILATPETYTNPVYGYSFSHPSGAEVRETTPEALAVGTTTSGTFDSLASVSVMKATPQAHYGAFTDFAKAQASSLCRALDPNVMCPDASRMQDFTSATGPSGSVFYMRFIRTDPATKQVTTREAGPFYAFDISAAVKDSSMAALFIYPTHFAEESTDYDTGASLANLIANTVQMQTR